jgi:hypothetical protein
VQDPRELLPAAPDSSGFVGSAGVGAVSAGYVPEVAKVFFVAQSETNSVSWADDAPHPWRRYFARSLDLSINGSITGLIVALLWAFIDEKVAERFLGYASGNKIMSGFFASLPAIPLDAILIAPTGCTLGKWFFGVLWCSGSWRGSCSYRHPCRTPTGIQGVAQGISSWRAAGDANYPPFRSIHSDQDRFNYAGSIAKRGRSASANGRLSDSSLRGGRCLALGYVGGGWISLNCLTGVD